MGTFGRHLSVLLWKNSVLKRRQWCSSISELFVAIGSVALAAYLRHITTIQAVHFEAEHHVMQSMLVHLPDCAEFLPDCSVELVKSMEHSASCVKGITFGCKGDAKHSGQPGVWVMMGCAGTFHLKSKKGEHTLFCEDRGRLTTCSLPVCDVEVDEREPCDDQRLSGLECLHRGCCYSMGQCFRPRPHRRLQKFSPAALLGFGQGGVQRLDATFAVAGPGAEDFADFLQKSRHPWASSVRIFDSAAAVERHVTDASYPRRSATASEALCGAVVFDSEPWSREVQYTLRFNQSLGYDPNLPAIAAVFRSTRLSTWALIEPKKGPKRFDGSGLSWYSQSGFLAMQRTVDTFLERIEGPGKPVVGAFSAEWLGEDGRPHVVVPFPTPEGSVDMFAMLMAQHLSDVLLISLGYSVNRMITGVVSEREARLREGMRMMGMHSSAFYASWVLTYVVLYLFVVSGMVLLLSGGSILPRSSPSLLFVWLMIFSLASIAYGLVITTFFTRAKTAATVGSILFYTTSTLKYLANPGSSVSTLRLLSLLPPVAFELGVDLVARKESQQVGITWSNVSMVDQNYSLLESISMLSLGTLLLALLFLYLDQIMPREVGLQRPFYFCVSPSFYRDLFLPKAAASAASAASAACLEAGEDTSVVAALVEKDLGEAAAMMSRNGQTVEISKLSKSFGQLRAVENLDVVMYQGEIFALLGHNGAGKTTTLTMLCGLIPPSSGRCLVFGSDRAEDAQRCLGVCPQHDVLWDTLTCEEHLQLFAGFKGVAAEAVSQEVSYMLERVGLEQAGASKTQAGRLSGGMKRKLSLGIAFLGGSQLVVLDEPTSGLDPFSRRTVWELLRSMKQGRVTVLSTHYMDEADILGDRIAILHEGHLKCCGSPQFLKRAYDCGYNVTFVKRPGCDIEAVREAVCRHVPELTSEVLVLSNSGKELILQFPFDAARHFPKVLGSVEEQLEELRLESYGISVTTLEEVFLKVASGDVVPRSKRASPTHTEYIELGEMGVEEELPAREVRFATKPSASCIWQTQALMKKRVKYGLRDRRGVLCQLFMPTATLLLFLMFLSYRLFGGQPILELSVLDFNKDCDSNQVEFSHLPAIDRNKAMAILKPGEELWHGHLHYHSPPHASEEDLQVEQAAFVDAPGLLERLLKMEGRERRLSKAHEYGRKLAEKFTSMQRAREALEAVANSIPQGDHLMSAWMNLLREAVAVEGRRLQAMSSFPRMCPEASKPERMTWNFLDRDKDGFISPRDLKALVRELRRHTSASTDFAEELLKDRVRQLGFDLADVASEEDVDAWMDWIAEESILSLLDLDGDGVVSQQEFCDIGAELSKKVSHFYNLAMNFSQQILDAKSSCPRYGAFYVVAEPRSGDSYTAADAIIFANASSKHSAPVYQAALTNARLARLQKQKRVAVKVHLFPQTKDENISMVHEWAAVFMLSIYITFCLSFIPAGITHYLVKERSSGARQLQALSGASNFAYWFSNLFYDMLLYVPPAASVPLALSFFGYHSLLEGECGHALLCVLAAFGPAIAGFSYVVSFFFKDHSWASNSILSFCLVGAIVLSTALFVLDFMNFDPSAQYPFACERPTEDYPDGTCRSPEARTAARILGPLFRLVPTVCVYQALFSIAVIADLKAVIPDGAMDALKTVAGSSAKLNVFDSEWAGEPLMYLIAEGVAFFILTVLMDVAIHSPGLARHFDLSVWMHRLKWVRRRGIDETRLSPLIEGGALEGDDSVWGERERAAFATKEDLALHVWDLEKTYRRWISCRPPKKAVQGISFAIHSGEVFGLLGHNGAGKTSAIKCFVGEQCCSSGAVHVGGFDMERQTSRARQRLGYCPQFDALMELLTVEDHLEFFASLRGLPRQAVEDTLQDFKLVKMAKRRAEVLSGGNKRKLSAALALMGSPALAILDEPSCGLDPAARRALWTAVHEAVAVKSGRTGAAVLLTTHSMEEAEALSNRLGIMADGQLLTVGTAQQIKAKHGSCHELMLRLRPEREEVLSSLTRQWAGALDANCIARVLELDSWKRAAYSRPRCIARLQVEQSGVVEASVFAEWFLQQAKGERMEQFLTTLIGDHVELAEDFGIYWRFRLPRSGLSIPQLFQQLEDNAENLGVAEYTLSQATLEQIFNSITEGSDAFGQAS